MPKPPVQIKEKIPCIRINGDLEHRLCNTSSVSFEYIEGESILMLLDMNDPYSPVESGTRGTVVCVDSMAQIHMQWDNGRTLPLNSDEDSFRTLTAAELAEEQNQQVDEDEDEDMGPVLGM